MSYAHATIAGFLGADPETKQVGDNTCTTLRVAATRRAKRQGADIEITTWWRAQVWGPHGLAAGKHLHKGDPVIISGWPEQREWTDNQGAKHAASELANASWAFAPSRKSGTATAPTASATPAPTTAPASTPVPDEPPF